MGSNKTVLGALSTKLRLSRRNAKVLFRDLCRFLQLCASTSYSLTPTRKIDSAWHVFLELEAEYARHCAALGRYVNHVVSGDSDSETLENKRRAEMTIALAQKRFGALSNNWKLASSSCSNCFSGCKD